MFHTGRDDIRCNIRQFSILSHQYWFSQWKQLTSYKMSSPYCLFVIYTNRVAPAEHLLHGKASNLLPEWHGGSHCGVGMLLLAGQTYTSSHQVEVFGMWERTLPFNLQAPALFHSLSCEVGKLCQGQTSGQSEWDKPSSSRSVSTKSWSYRKYSQPVSDHICTTMSFPPGALNMLSQLIHWSVTEYKALLNSHTCLPRLAKDSALRADWWLGVSASTQIKVAEKGISFFPLF